MYSDEFIGYVQNYLHLEVYETLFSGIKKLVAGLSILLLPKAGGGRAVLDAQDTGCGHHPGSPTPALV
jgi:hypothetical protein